MGATEEQMALLSALEVTHVSYVLILFSITFLLFLYVSVLLHIYAQHAWPIEKSKPIALPSASIPPSPAPPRQNGSASRGLTARERQSVQDAEEFELTGLIDGEDDIRTDGNEEESSLDSGSGRRKEVTS